MGTQASLPAELVPLGATSLLFVISASCAIFLAIGNAIFESQLRKNLEGVVSATLLEKVISTGATHVRSVIPDEYISAVISAYSKSVTQVFVCSSNTLRNNTKRLSWSTVCSQPANFTFLANISSMHIVSYCCCTGNFLRVRCMDQVDISEE